MDYMKFVEYHRNEDADITVGCLPVDETKATEFGLMNIDAKGVITVNILQFLSASFPFLRSEKLKHTRLVWTF